MGQTAAEAKREVDETRAHLAQTLEAIQLRARRNLDLPRQLQTNRTLQVTLAGLLLALVTISLIWSWWRSRLSTSERVLRRLKLNELRDGFKDVRGNLKGWTAIGKRIIGRSSKSGEAVPPHRETGARRLFFSAAEAALTALAAGLAKRMIERRTLPHDQAHPPAAVSRKR